MKNVFLILSMLMIAHAAHAERIFVDRDGLPSGNSSRSGVQPSASVEVPSRDAAVLHERFCDNRFAMALNQMEFIVGKWFREENPTHNIPQNFDKLVATHKIHLDAILAFSQRALPEQVRTSEDLRIELAKLNSAYIQLLDKYRPMVTGDHEFLEKLTPVFVALEISARTLEMKTDGCSAEIVAKIDDLKAARKNLQEQVLLAKQYATLAAEKRETAINIARRIQRVNLETKLAQALTTSLSNIQNDIGKIFFVGDLEMEIANWSYFNAEISPCTKYFAFSACVNAIESEMFRGNKLRKKIEKASLYGNSKEVLLKEVDNYLELVAARRSKYLAAGWQDFYARRKKNVVEGLLPYPQYLNAECLVAAKKYAAMLKVKATESDSRNSEEEYVKVARICLFTSEVTGGVK